MKQSRLSNLPENVLVTTINDTLTALDELKTKQQIAGANINFHQSDSGQPYDWNGTITQGPLSASGGNRALQVTVTALNAPVLFIDVVAQLYVGSLNNLYTVKNFVADAYANTSTRPTFSVEIFEGTFNNPDATNKAVFDVFIAAGTGGDGISSTDAAFTTPCFLKLFVVANDDVTIELTRVRR